MVVVSPGYVLVERLVDVVDEIRRLGFERALDDDQRLARGRCVGRLRSTIAGIDHRLEHDVAPLAAPLRVVEGRQRRRRLQHARHRRRLGERDVADVLAEEQPRRLGDAEESRTSPR